MISEQDKDTIKAIGIATARVILMALGVVFIGTLVLPLIYKLLKE